MKELLLFFWGVAIPVEMYGTPLLLILRKSDGGYNYATTDLAAIKQRIYLQPEDKGEKAD